MVAGGGDIEQYDFVGTVTGVSIGTLRGVAGVAKILELHSLHHAASGDVETGDDALGQQSNLTEVFENEQPGGSRLLGVKLDAENVSAFDRGRKWESVF